MRWGGLVVSAAYEVDEKQNAKLKHKMQER
jgi:hypothetical protein